MNSLTLTLCHWQIPPKLAIRHRQVRESLQKALDLFDRSYSVRKKQLIQTMVPKLILDEKTDRLHIFINPFLENLGQIVEEKIEDFAAFLPKNRKSGNFESSMQIPETPAQILSQSEKKVCIATEWRHNFSRHGIFSSIQLSSPLRHFV